MMLELPGHLKEFVAREVAAGHYPSASAVIEDALERLSSEEDTRMSVVEAVAEARASVARGESVPWTDDFLQRSRERALEHSRRGRVVREDVRY